MKSGAIGWAGLVAYVAAYDFWAIQTDNETMSAFCWRSIQHPKWRALAVTLTVLVAKHLLAPDFAPKADPINFIAERMKNV